MNQPLWSLLAAFQRAKPFQIIDQQRRISVQKPKSSNVQSTTKPFFTQILTKKLLI